MIPRPLFFLLRALFAAFCLLTAAYCLLAYIPFTYQQVHVGELLPWFSFFGRHHAVFYWIACAALLPTILPDLRARRTRLVAWIYCGLLALAGIVLLFVPLAGLRNDNVGLYGALLALAPLLGVAFLDWRGHAHELRWSGANHADLYCFAAAWQSALYLAVVYAFVAFGRSDLLAETSSPARLLAIDLGWSLLSHAVLFSLLLVTVDLVGGIASVFRLRARAAFLGASVALVALLWLFLTATVFPTISFFDWRAHGLAVTLAATLVVYTTGLSVRLFRAGEGILDGGFELLLLPMRFLRAWGPTARLWFFTGLTALAGYLAVRGALFDWNFLLQKIAAVLIWSLTFAGFYMLARSGPARPRPVVAFACSTAVIFGYLVLLLAGPPLDQDRNPTALAATLDEFAGYDASFHLVHDALSNSRRSLSTRADDSFYNFLAANTHIPRSTRVEPLDLNLVPDLQSSGPNKPDIYLLVIDSLRRDYLSPYNPAVRFTPGIAAFAADSVVMRNAFTHYGGTGLSEPSIWVGGMLVHKQYVTPFAPMNALQKLITAEGYHAYVTDDPILKAIGVASPSLTELDAGATPAYDLCTTLRELTGDLERTADSPVFAYTQPQNIHVSVIDREGRSVPPGAAYPGFDAAYASRIERLDGCFTSFVQFLKRTGRYDNSIIVLTADHGDSLGERGRWGHAFSLFPEIVRVPLIVHLPPDMRAVYPTDPEQIAFLTDLTPSLYYLLGHRALERDRVLGRPLFIAHDDPSPPPPDSYYLIASSYAPVYGILADNGNTLYVADGVSYSDYLFDLSASSGGVSRTLTDAQRDRFQQQIRSGIQAISRFYHFQTQ